MAVIVSAPDPAGLLRAIREAIDAQKVATWSYDSDGDFTHTAEQWKYKAWLRPRQEQGLLIFNILTPKNTTLSTPIYAVYHGRFIEMLLAHFDEKFSRASASALPASPDVIRG
jgi:hypothetical protein